MTRRPLLLDLFCGAGGAAKGYAQAGFDVIGVDNVPQPHYPFFMIQTDAIKFLRGVVASVKIPDGYTDDYDVPDAIHASPPCQSYSTLRHLSRNTYPDLIASVRDLLEQTGLPWVIENVEGSPLRGAFRLCGSSFGLGVRRHRRFEMSRPPAADIPRCQHESQPEPIDVSGNGGRQISPRRKVGGGRGRKPVDLAEARAAIGMPWSNRRGISQAVPPAYTEWVGHELLRGIE